MYLEQEFKTGDIVTFRAYPDQNIKAKVVRVGRFGFDDGITYKLEGISKPLISETSGRSIKESKHFKCPVKHPFKW